MNINLTKIYIMFKNKFINIFNKHIILIEHHNKLVSNPVLFILSKYLYLFNFKYLLKYNNINIIYKLNKNILYDEIYNKKLIICNIIIDCYLYNNETGAKLNIIDKIKQYSMNMPIYIIINLEEYNKQDILYIKVIVNRSIKWVNYPIVDILNKRLYELV